MVDQYQSGGFAPVRVERDLEGVAIDGAWPKELDGTLYRIGPNPQFRPIEPYNPLQGDGMVHAFHISAGTIAYRNRWVRTRQWQLEHAAGRALFATSGDPRRNDPSVTGLTTDGVANTNLVWHGGRLLALEEGHAPIALHPATLETQGQWRFDGALPHNMTAHPKLDPTSGELVCFANEPERRFSGSIGCYVFDRNGVPGARRDVATPFPGIVHDFAVTADFIVLLVCPVVISLARLRAGQPPLAWEPERPVHVGVFRRDGSGEVSWLETDACFVWHVLNAWNDGDRLTVDLCEQATPAFPHADGSPTETTSRRQYFSRWQFDATGARIERTRLSEVVCEYPRIDERFAMTETRHGFFASHGGPGTGDDFHRGISHFSHTGGGMVTHRFDPGEAASEPVFVPRSPGAVEGDGWLISVVYDETQDRSDLVVLDSRDVAAGPIARARLPCRVPMGFHGIWVPADSGR